MISRSRAVQLKTLVFLFAAAFLSLRPAQAESRPAAFADTTGTRLVQPGAPGQPARVIEGGDEAAATLPSHTEADVHFMHGMILHHAQALEMTALVPDRSESDDIRRLALRLETSQHDEILQMLRWLEKRDESLPPLPEVIAELEEKVDGSPADDENAHHGEHAHTAMYGMLSQEELDRLAEASGEEFDRLFLELMIQHHEGALVMVDELFAAEGAGQEGEIYTFASHIESDQIIEIERMRRMLQAD